MWHFCLIDFTAILITICKMSADWNLDVKMNLTTTVQSSLEKQNYYPRKVPRHKRSSQNESLCTNQNWKVWKYKLDSIMMTMHNIEPGQHIS